MRNLITFILLLVSGGAFSQAIPWQAQPFNVQFKRVIADSGLAIPKRDTIPVGFNNRDSLGSLVYKTSNNTIYYKDNIGWKQISSASTPTLQQVTATGNTTNVGIASTGLITSYFPTGPQLRVGADGSNNMSFTGNATGSMTLDLAGTAPTFTFAKLANFNGGFTSASTNFNIYTNAVSSSGTTSIFQYLAGGSTASAIRVGIRGSTTVTLLAGQSAAALFVGQNTWVGAATGNHPVVAGLIAQAPIYSTGGATSTYVTAGYFNNPTGGFSIVSDTGKIQLNGATTTGNLLVNGSLGLGDTTFTATGTAPDNKVTIWVNNSGLTTINLPTAVGRRSRIFIIKKVSVAAFAVTVDPAGTETIDGAPTAVLTSQYNFIVIQTDGANWFQISPAL